MLSDAGMANYRTMDSTHQLLLQQQQQQQQQQQYMDDAQKRGFLSKCFSSLCSCL
jgi:hypothetical protein